jgi:hypothetical protein
LHLNIAETDLFFGVCCAVIKIEELHAIKFFIAEEYLVWAQISVHNVLLVDEFKQINDLKTDVN